MISVKFFQVVRMENVKVDNHLRVPATAVGEEYYVISVSFMTITVISVTIQLKEIEC